MLKGYGGYDEHFEIQALKAKKGGWGQIFSIDWLCTRIHSRNE